MIYGFLPIRKGPCRVIIDRTRYLYQKIPVGKIRFGLTLNDPLREYIRGPSGISLIENMFNDPLFCDSSLLEQLKVNTTRASRLLFSYLYIIVLLETNLR